MTHDEIVELLGAYALDAVDPDERDVLDAHLVGCPRCRAEVQEHREVAALMANTGGAAPEGVWQRIAGSLDDAPPELRLAPVVRSGDPARADVVPLERAWRWPRALIGVAAAAAVVLVAVLGFEVRDQSQRIDELQVALEDPAAASYESALAREDTRRIELAAADGTTLEGVVTGDGFGYLQAGSLPDLGAERTYQLWAVDGDAPVSLGTIGADPAVVTFRAEGWETFAISEESTGGSVAPTSDPVVVGGFA